MKMLDLFCGRWGWSRKFAERGHECVGIDLTPTPDIPANCTFLQQDILNIKPRWIELQGFDFICASSPCEQFSVHGMKHFHPNPPYPELGIKLFEHTRALCEASGVPYVMENVRAAQAFVGQAQHHCGPFYLWGTGVPPLVNQGINKKQTFRGMPEREYESAKSAGACVKTYRNKYQQVKEREAVGITGTRRAWSSSEARKIMTAQTATIPPELANTVCDYAERLLESRVLSS